MKNKALKRSLLIVPASAPLIGLVLTLSANHSKQDVNVAINNDNYVFDKVNSNISDDIWTGYDNYSNGTVHRWYNSLDANGVTNLSQTGNNKLKWSATGDAWYRLFDASTPGLPSNINQTNWNGEGFANEIGNMYSWERDGASSSLPENTGSWWNGNGYNPLTNTKKVKVGVNLTNADTNNDFFTAGIYFSDDIRLVGDIKIHLFVKEDSSSVNIDQTEGKLTTYTININDDPKANIDTMEISPWIGKTQQVTGTGKSVSTTINGKSKTAYISDYAYLPYYDHIPDEYENNMSDANRNQRNWWKNTRQQGSNELYDVLIRGYTPQAVRNYNFTFTTNKFNQVAFGLFQHSIIRDKTPIITKNNITQNQGGLFVFRVNTSTSHNEIVAGAVVELEMKPFNNSTEPFNQLYAGNTGSTTEKKTYFGVSEYRNLNSRDDYKVIGGFIKMADRKQSYLKKFNTEEKIQNDLEFYNKATDGIPQANLSISENWNSAFAYNIDKNGVSYDNKNVIRTRNIYQDYKKYNNLDNLRLNASFAPGTDTKKWRMINKTSTASASTTFGREYLDFAPIEYTFTDLEYLKRYIQSKKWLTKGEKDALTRYVEADTSFNVDNEFTNETAKNSWKDKIDKIDDLQKSIEEKYKEVREYPLNTQIYDRNWNTIATNKMLYALADIEVKKALEDFINTNSSIIKLKSDEYNNDAKAQDRNNSSKYSTLESFDFLSRILQTIKKVLGDRLDAILTSGKNNLNSLYSKLNDYEITKANSQTYLTNNTRATNLLTNNLIQNVIDNLTTAEEVKTFNSTTSKPYESNIKNVLDTIANLNSLVTEKNNLKTQILEQQKPQNDFKNYAVFTKSTNSINLNSFDTFDANLKDANNKTIPNIFESTSTLTTFYTNGKNTLQQNWIDKLTGDELNGAVEEFKKEINNFTFLNGNDTSGEKFYIINSLEGKLGWQGPFAYNAQTKTLAINANYYSTINDEMQLAFDMAIDNAKNQINSLTYLSQDEKDNVKRLIGQAQLYKDTYVANEDYSDKVLIGSDKNIKTIVDKWTDINNEREKIKDYSATFGYPDKNIKPSTADQNLITTDNINPNNQGVETKIIGIQADDNDGTLVVTYKILKSSDKDNIYTENKTYKITGFSDEQSRIETLSATPEYKEVNKKPNIQASTVEKANNANVDIVWQLPTNTKIYANSVRYLGYNDITGKIKIAYKLQSTKDVNAISAEKTAEITGFQNEVTRLNNLVNQDSNTNKITNITIVSNPIKRASDSTLNTDYNVGLIDSKFANTNKISLTNVNQTSTDDASGSVTYTYKFKTTRLASDLVTIEGQTVNNNNIYSNVTNPQTRDGFLTQAQYEQNQKDAKKKAIDNYKYLNDAQKNAIKEAIQNASIDQLDQKVANASDLNDAMKAYNDATNNIETIKKGRDYTQADNKSALDDAVNQQKTDVDKTQGSNLSLEEVKKRTKAIQDAISNLNGDERLKAAKDKAIAKVNSDYSSLTDKQKEKAIALINAKDTIADVNSQDATNNALNSSMETLRDFITNQNTVVTNNNYIYTTNDLRAAYDGNPAKNNGQKGGAIKKAEDLLTALNTGNNSDLMNKTNVDSMNTEIQNAINNLNGQQRYNDELTRLNSLETATAKVKDNSQNTKTASEITKDDVEFNNSTIPADVKPVDWVISNPNELTGKLDLSYKYQSTKENLESVQSIKTYTLNNNNALSTLTEQERVDAILDDSNISFTINENDTNAIDRNQLPSEVAKEAIKGFNNPANLDVEGYLNSIELLPNNDNGTLDITFKIASTKAILNSNNDPQNPAVVSTNTRTITLTGFKTTLQAEKEKVAQYINNNVPEPKKQALLDELTKANTLDEVAKVQVKAEIEKAIADASNNYPYLNNNQLDAYKSDLKSATSTEAIQAHSTTASTLNAKMKELSDAVKAELTALTKKTVEDDQNNDAKTAIVYTLADADKKQAYDNALSAAQEILNKANGANSELSAVETVLSNLQTAYGELNGDENQNALNERIDALNNLTSEQEQALKDKIDGAANKEEANKIIEAAKNLDKAIGDLKAKIAEAEGKKDKLEYTDDTTGNQAKFDKAIQDAKKALKGYQAADLSNLNKDQIAEKTGEINTQTSTLNDAIDALDGYRNKFKEDLNNWELLDASQIKALQDKVDNLQKQPTQEEKSSIIQEGLSLSKTNASNKINNDNYANLSSEEITELLGKVNSAELDETQGHKYDAAVKAIIQEAEQLNQNKQAAINAINDLSDLTLNQKAVFENQVKTLPTSQASTVQETATALNTAILEAKNVVKEQIQKLAKDDKLTYETAKSANKVADKYRLADAALKETYDEKLQALNDLIVKDNASKTEIDNAKTELISAYNALNGEENKNKKAKAVDKLDNLSKDQKDKIKDLLNNATDEEAAQKILEKAQKLNLDLGDLEKQITSTEAKVATSIYTNDAQDRKEAVDQALENAKNKLAELKAKDLSNATADSLNGLANEANQSKEALKTADEALDGNREVLRNDINNHFPSLNENQKGLLIAEIEKLSKVPTQEETQAIYDKALKYAQTNAKDELAKLDNLTKAEKDTYIAKIDAATLDKTNEDFAINVKNLLDQAKADETAKAQAIETIDNLTNLNPAQKSSLTEEIKNNKASEANNIVKKAKAIDDKMKAYKDIAEVDKTSVDYVEADEDRQVKYNNQEAIRTEDLGDNGTNLSVEQIDAKITELNNAINGLNGDEKVAQAKENAIAKINGENPIYNNLTDQQKVEAIAKINEKDRVADVNSVDANNALVNGTMATLDQYLNNETKIKNDINYTGSEEDLRKAYDDAIQALKDYETALNEPSNDTKNILSNDKIEEKINAVHEAINNLNGKEHIKTVRAEEIAKINALENINDAQKLALIAKVDKATTPEDVRAVTEEAAALDEKMVELKQAVADNQDTPNSVDYKNATEEKMREFDKAFNNASNLADKENGSAELSIDNIDSLIEKLNVAAQNLDGDEKINNKKAEARNLINGLEHLNDAQKAALIKEVDKAKLLANVDKVVDKAQTLNNAMGQLKETAKAINDELTQPDNPKYVAASQEPKANYDEAKAKVDELISNQGSNEDVAKVLELEKALIDAKNALDGDKNFEYAKAKAIEKVNKNNNLTPAEKQALIDQIKDLAIPSNSDNADEVQNFKDNLDKIVNKTNLINNVKNNANLTPEQKADLINDIEKANVDDKLNSEVNKNSYSDTLNNIKAKEKAYERINATDDLQLNAEDKAKLSDNISQLDPRDKTFADQLTNEELKENKIKEIRSNPNLTDNQKSQLIDEVANLDNKQSDLVDQIAKIDQKAKLIEKIQTNEHISDEDKSKLVNEVINVPHDNSKLTDKLNNIESKLNLIDQIKQNTNLDENNKEALIDQVHNLAKDSDNFATEADNISAKVKAIEQIKANDELTKGNKANLVDEIINLDNNQTKSSLDYQISNVDKKAKLYEQINQSDLPQSQKDALIAELDPINANSENASVSFDNIKDQLNKLSKINNDQTLSDNDKAKLVEDVLANNPTEQNYNEITKNINKKQEAIDQIRQNPNLTQEQKDSISQNIRELDETSEEFTNKLDNEKARLDLIDQLHQEAKDNKISDETRDKLISETLNLVNDSSFINNLNNVKVKDKLIQQVKASDVLNDKTKATLINNILDNNATSEEFDNKHNQITQLYVDAEELAKAKNDLVDLTESKKFEKLTKYQKDAINKAIADSDEILNNLNSHNNEDVVKQTTIDKKIKEISPILIWPYFVATSVATWLIGMLIFIFGRKKK
ncbi:lipoprotein 17-related variable surface protein [Mycoplasma sp. 2704]|uniref:lipoprotein 17-related variable surface protein n=1 Tax=Mycoplasma sp. 2704 TaxID=3108529 RepID=UPI002B1E3C65|nr:lipoprotein 17-related variable surface protein [Mycoplasma sp. 2704]MEA4134191.1 lipoprotein 17-related variable surface protein [Mycoplasma sp. 2704]